MNVLSGQNERGFSSLELLLAVALAFGIGVAALSTLQAAGRGITRMTQATTEITMLDELERALRRDAASAIAIRLPARDALGLDNSDGHDVEFVTTDTQQRFLRWGYVFSGTLRRIAIGLPDAPPAISTGVDTVQSFTVRQLQAASLAEASNRYASVLNGLPPPQTHVIAVGADAVAGNSIYEVSVATAHNRRIFHLTAGVAPTGFGIEHGAVWHAVIWREAHTRRFLFGLGQKSWFNIFGEVVYSTDGWKTSHRWCTHEIYDGLDVSDPRGAYTYRDASETAQAVFKACQSATRQNEIPLSVSPTRNTSVDAAQ